MVLVALIDQAVGTDGPAPTWGIPGPLFLVVYGLLFAVAVVLVLLTRVIIDRRLRRRPPPIDQLDDAGLAVLAGDERAGGLTALYGLWRRGAIVARNDTVDAIARDGKALDKLWRRSGALSPSTTLAGHAELGPDAPLLDRALLGAIARREVPTVTDVLADPDVRGATARLAASLEDRGLVRSARTRRAMRLASAWFVPLIGLGTLRIQAGQANHRAVAFLILAVAGTVGAFLLALVVPRMPATTKRQLTQARWRERQRRGEVRRLLADGGSAPEETRLLALYGAGFLLPAAALLFAPPRPLPTTGGFWGGGGDSGGGCGGSSCSGGSSCGGGGGCGGGGCGG